MKMKESKIDLWGYVQQLTRVENHRNQLKLLQIMQKI